jgi:hypothetical protein
MQTIPARMHRHPIEPMIYVTCAMRLWPRRACIFARRIALRRRGGIKTARTSGVRCVRARVAPSMDASLLSSSFVLVVPPPSPLLLSFVPLTGVSSSRCGGGGGGGRRGGRRRGEARRFRRGLGQTAARAQREEEEKGGQQDQQTCAQRRRGNMTNICTHTHALISPRMCCSIDPHCSHPPPPTPTHPPPAPAPQPLCPSPPSHRSSHVDGSGAQPY